MKKLTYIEACVLARIKLKSVKNLRKWCRNNDLNYQLALIVKNNSGEKKYPHFIEKCLRAFDYPIVRHEKTYVFHLEKGV